VELDAARPQGHAPARLGQRLLVERQAHERDQPAVALGRPPQDAVVRRAVGGRPVGLVEREHEGALDAVAVHLRQVLLEREPAAVLVAAQVRVGVHHAGAGGKQVLQAAPVAVQQIQRVLEGVPHRAGA
jgi:hypothetical protein